MTQRHRHLLSDAYGIDDERTSHTSHTNGWLPIFDAYGIICATVVAKHDERASYTSHRDGWLPIFDAYGIICATVVAKHDERTSYTSHRNGWLPISDAYGIDTIPHKLL